MWEKTEREARPSSQKKLLPVPALHLPDSQQVTLLPSPSPPMNEQTLWTGNYRVAPRVWPVLGLELGTCTAAASSPTTGSLSWPPWGLSFPCKKMITFTV